MSLSTNNNLDSIYVVETERVVNQEMMTNEVKC